MYTEESSIRSGVRALRRMIIRMHQAPIPHPLQICIPGPITFFGKGAPVYVPDRILYIMIQFLQRRCIGNYRKSPFCPRQVFCPSYAEKQPVAVCAHPFCGSFVAEHSFFFYTNQPSRIHPDPSFQFLLRLWLYLRCSLALHSFALYWLHFLYLSIKNCCFSPPVPL